MQSDIGTTHGTAVPEHATHSAKAVVDAVGVEAAKGNRNAILRAIEKVNQVISDCKSEIAGAAVVQ